MRALTASELDEFDQRVLAQAAGEVWRRPLTEWPNTTPDTDADIAYRFGIKIGAVRRLKAERQETLL